MGELLISKGADINAKNVIRQYIISSFSIIMKQIKGRNLNKNNYTPLHSAVHHYSVRMGELLISKGADINVKSIIHQYIFHHF